MSLKQGLTRATGVGAYRGLYILNWIYRFATEPHYWQVRRSPARRRPGTVLSS